MCQKCTIYPSAIRYICSDYKFKRLATMNAKKILLVSASLFPLGPAVINAEEKLSPKPNVIIILADDLGYGDIKAYGASQIPTPNIDRLAYGGIRMMNGYATSATSTPSRYALMTGMYPWKNKSAKILPGDAPLIISPKQYTLPRMMQDAGYCTGAIGKWHLGMGDGAPDWNTTVCPGAKEIGFDYSCLIAATNDRVPIVYVENGNVIGLEKDDPIEVNYKKNYPGEPTGRLNPELLKMQPSYGHNGTIVNGISRIGFMRGGKAVRWTDEDMADYFANKVSDFIDENKKRPFFLYYGLHQPHVPRTPHARFVGKTTLGPRGDAIVEADWCVGELIKKLEKEQLLDNTLIIFTSDNGPVLDDGYKDFAKELVGNHQPTGGLRGGKYSLFDAGTHVPFLAYWHSQIMPAKSEALISQLDILASLAKLVNIEVPADLDSEEHLDVLLGKSRQGRTDLVIEASRKLAYRKNNYVLIPPYKGKKAHISGNEMGNLQEYSLFDLLNDPKQIKDLSMILPDTLETLKQVFFEKTRDHYIMENK